MSDPALEALWQQVTKDWESENVHNAFLQHCQSTDQLLEAAVRYRGMTGDRDRGASAEKRLKAVAILAVSGLEASRSRRPERRRNLAAILLILAFSAGSIALLLLL